MNSLEWVMVTREEMKEVHGFPMCHFIVVSQEDKERFEKSPLLITDLNAEEIRRRVERVFEGLV